MLHSEEVICYGCKFCHQYPDPLLLRKKYMLEES